MVLAAGRSIFQGGTLEKFVGWLRGIARNQISTHYRARERRPQTCSLDVPAVDPRALGGRGDPADRVDLELDIEAALGEMLPSHRKVAEMLVLEGCSAAEVTGCVSGMTAANAYQIASRFRRQLKSDLLAG